MAGNIEDARFAHISKDPRFRKLPRKERKLKIDKRFKPMFTDDSFKLKCSVDKRGRPVQFTSKENLKKYYDLSESGDDSNEEEVSDASEDVAAEKGGDNNEHVSQKKKLSTEKKSGKKLDKKTKKNQKFVVNETKSDKNLISSDEDSGIKNELVKTSSDEESSDDDDDSVIDPFTDIRGEGVVTSSSDEDESSEDEDDQFDHAWGELDADTERSEEISHRFAACNMDWDRIKATDLLVLFNSFKPPEGIIRSVKIFLSDFGKERLQEEQLNGPKELCKNEGGERSEQQAKEGKEFHMEKLRKYQLNRLKYYYAVVECDTRETANKIYSECDGIEYEASSTKLDLRFIPDDVTFDQEPSSVADSLPEAGNYEPSQFTTKALQQAKVELTWDETNPDRTKTILKAFDDKNFADNDLKAYLASSSEDDDNDGEDEKRVADIEPDSLDNDKSSIAKYKALILDIEKKEKEKKDGDIEMEVSWEPGLKSTSEKEIKDKAKSESLTPWGKYLEKKKEKQASKKKAKDLSEENDELLSDDQPFSDDDIPSDVDLNDPYFREEFEKSAGKKKKKKQKSIPAENSEDEKSKAELELLMMDETSDAKHFNMKNIIENESKSKSKKKRKRKAQDKLEAADEFQINVSDPRFDALYTSHDYNIDPSEQSFKRTKAMDDLIQEKQRRRENNEIKQVSKPVNSSKDDNLSMLVKSVKNKTNRFIKRKKK